MDAEHLGQARPAIRAPYRLQWEEAQAAWVMLYPEGMVKLSASAGEIMKRCDGRLTVNALIEELEALFETPRPRPDLVGPPGGRPGRGFVPGTPAAEQPAARSERDLPPSPGQLRPQPAD